MNRDDSLDTLPRIPEGPEMIEAMRRGVIAALEGHKRIGNSIVTFDLATDRISEIPADEILIEDAQPAPASVNQS